MHITPVLPDLQAKKKHVSMCVVGIVYGRPVAMADYLLVLLDQLASLCSLYSIGNEPRAKAINNALPGRSFC